MKNFGKTVFSFCVMLLMTHYSYSQEISLPYDYPVKPGTDEWKKLQNQDEMIEVCQIPETILKNLSTEALAKTCLNYPLYPQITAYNNVQSGFDKFANNFNGFAELINRSDAGLVLLQKYRSMDPSSYPREWSSVKKGQFIYEYLFIEMLLAQDKIIAKLSSDRKIELAKECLKKYEGKVIEKDLFGLVGLSHTSYVMLKTLNMEDDKDYKSLHGKDEKVKAFQETANVIDIETLSKIREVTMSYINKQ
jgi:hypothetical protein